MSEGQECVELYLYSPNAPSWRGVQSIGTTLPLPDKNLTASVAVALKIQNL
jgi:hypothetical protein